MAEDEGGCCTCSLVLGVGVVAFLYFFRRYLRGGQYTDDTRADGKVAVVTGANAGIGRATAQLLNLRGAKVYMLCRNQERGETARNKMIEAGCDPSRLIVRVVDLENFKTIRVFARMFRDEEPRLDILVNNAGQSGWPTFEKTVDGFEKIWQANYLGHFLLTELLRPQLYQSKDARIINVSSIMHQFADTVREEIVSAPEHYSKWSVYNRTKLAQVMHARWLTHLMREKDIHNVSINACHPGSVDSNIFPHGLHFIKTIFYPIFWYFMKTEEDGAQTSLFLALSSTIQGVSGLYFRDLVSEAPHKLVNNSEECELLYNKSKAVVTEPR